MPCTLEILIILQLFSSCARLPWFYSSLLSKNLLQSLPLFKLGTLSSLCSCGLVAKSGLTLLWSHGLEPARLLCPWDFPGKNTGMGCHFLLQRIFPTQDQIYVSWIGRWIFYHCCQESPVLRDQRTKFVSIICKVEVNKAWSGKP